MPLAPADGRRQAQVCEAFHFCTGQPARARPSAAVGLAFIGKGRSRLAGVEVVDECELRRAAAHRRVRGGASASLTRSSTRSHPGHHAVQQNEIADL